MEFIPPTCPVPPLSGQRLPYALEDDGGVSFWAGQEVMENLLRREAVDLMCVLRRTGEPLVYRAGGLGL